MSLEQVLAEAEKAAESAIKTAASVASAARRVKKAASGGAFSGRATIKGGVEDAKKALENLQQQVRLLEAAAGRADAWPPEADDQPSFKESYTAELRSLAEAKDLSIREQDGVLVSFPTVVRVAQDDRSLQIDQKKINTIRPSRVIDILKDSKKKVSRNRPEPFLKAIYLVYDDLLSYQPQGTLANGLRTVVPLRRIYEHFTALPSSRKDYSKIDFARDLYLLESQGPKQFKKGAKFISVSFPASTGARGRADISFAGPDGYERKYYGIQFDEGL